MIKIGLKKGLKALERAIYPCYCAVCNKPDKRYVGICENCINTLPWCGSVCSTCGLPLDSSHNSLVCGRCQKIPPAYDSIRTAFWYETPIDHMVMQYKYFNQWCNAESLINLLMERIDYQSGEVVVPMPSHTWRIRHRGFNAVFELARILDYKQSMQIDFNYLRRIKHTATQTGKTEKQRQCNIKNAFQVTSNQVYKKVILFDDVVTTGATVAEASRCLKRHGVESIRVWALARTKLK